MQNLPLTPEQEETLGSWRIWALTKMPYFSPILFNFQPLNSPGLGTFACDERMRLYIDFETVESWGINACAEALLHEAGHIWGQHAAFARDWNIGPAEHRIWNAASDASINDDLVEAGCTYIESTGILPSQFHAEDHQTPRHYYDLLLNQVQQQQRDGSGGRSQPSHGDPVSAQDGQPAVQRHDTADDERSGAGDDEPFKGCGSASGGQPAPCELGDEGSVQGDAPGLGGLQVESVLSATARSITEHVRTGRGTAPSGFVAEAATFFDPPRVSWQRILSAYVRKFVRIAAGEQLTDFSRRDRRRHNIMLGDKKVILPGRGRPIVPLAVVRDTSGSMSEEELNRASAEIVGIAKSMNVRGRDLHILDVDAGVHTVKGYQQPAELGAITGRGGTDMRVGIKRALRLRPSPAAVIVLSDGGTPWPTVPTRTPVVAALVGPSAKHAAKQVPEWIRTIVVDD